MAVEYIYPLTKSEIAEGYTKKVWDGDTYLCRIETVVTPVVLQAKTSELGILRDVLNRNRREYEIKRKILLHKE